MIAEQLFKNKERPQLRLGIVFLFFLPYSVFVPTESSHGIDEWNTCFGFDAKYRSPLLKLVEDFSVSGFVNVIVVGRNRANVKTSFGIFPNSKHITFEFEFGRIIILILNCDLRRKASGYGHSTYYEYTAVHY